MVILECFLASFLSLKIATVSLLAIFLIYSSAVESFTKKVSQNMSQRSKHKAKEVHKLSDPITSCKMIVKWEYCIYGKCFHTDLLDCWR